MSEDGTGGLFLLAAVAVIVDLLVDHFGLAGRKPRPLTLGRAVGAGLILLGVALLLLGLLWLRGQR
ncbi:MAG: DMT family transporter [Actinomycetota bacterium]|nr:DMT family transporter [Actinomycetota bacterium]